MVSSDLRGHMVKHRRQGAPWRLENTVTASWRPPGGGGNRDGGSAPHAPGAGAAVDPVVGWGSRDRTEGIGQTLGSFHPGSLHV